MNYPSIRIEGAILSPDILEKIEDAPGQRPGDFNLDSSAKVKDEIARAWADAQDYWRIFQRKLEALKLDSPATTETRQQWMVPLLGLLGYQLEYQSRSAEINGKTYTISHRATNRAQTPVQIVGYREPAGLDRKPERSNVKMSAHAVVQEFLNLNEQLYGIVTNGRILRLLRDSSRLIKLSYLEFDLDRIFTDGLFADFAILYRLLHATRLPVTNDTAADSLIERYHQDSLDSGARIRDGLSLAVKRAILDFGNGFLFHPANEELRVAVINGELTPGDLYKNLLRLIYRLLFLMVIEERDLVFPQDATKAQREVYRRYYSVQRLRLLSEKRYLSDHRRHDLWLALTATFRLFEAYGPGIKLGIPPLAGDLFGRDSIGILSECTLGNDVLLGCLRSLSLYEHPDNHQLIRVNYGALNVEEFGSVYEGLLEYEPVFTVDGSHIEFAFQQGDERSATGSHYTPDELVQPLIKHSLDYLIAERLKAAKPEEALLDLRVADIACGSGHILLAAARRIATELAIVRTGEEQPSPSAYRTALRDVIRECIYGVDLNPLAVELCKVALWLEAHNPGQPLNFLDHHIKCGNSIVGFVHREELDKGVPDEAFAAMPGDNKEVGAALRKRNKGERKQKHQMAFELSPTIKGHLDAILSQWNTLSALPEHTPAEIEEKKSRFVAFSESRDAWLLNQIAAIPIAQFYIPKTEEHNNTAVTDDKYRDYLTGVNHPQSQATATALATAKQKRFFHWFLEFPEIMAEGGFDCILGNPPFLNGLRLSSNFGYAFLNWIYFETPRAGGTCDLVAYFFRRGFELIKNEGFLAMIATNTISQGDTREGSLQPIIERGGNITFAVKSIKWPGQANLEVALVSLKKGHWLQKANLEGNSVEKITSYLSDEEVESSPFKLAANENLCFVGSFPLGKGFVLPAADAEALISDDQKNRVVLFPYLIGDDLNRRPDQSPSRWIINFFDWPESRAQEFPECFGIVENLVKEVRLRDNRKAYRDYWWQYAEKRPQLYRSIPKSEQVLASCRVTKFLSFSIVPRHTVYDCGINVVIDDTKYLLAILQSTPHQAWARTYGSTLETRLRYTNEDCFRTFPFPQSLGTMTDTLEQVGEAYHEHRKALMLSLWLGLTDIYNLFHSRDLSPAKVAKVSKKSEDEAERGYEGLLELRHLHVELDNAVRDAYGWNDLDLGHDFYEVETLPENDRVRYTISPAACKEVLRRLLELNHTRAAEEAAAAPVKPKRGKKKTKSNDASPLDMTLGEL